MTNGAAHRCWRCGQVRLDVVEIQVMPGIRFEQPGDIRRTVEPLTRWVCESCRTKDAPPERA